MTPTIYFVEHNASIGLVTTCRRAAMAAALALFRSNMQRGRPCPTFTERWCDGAGVWHLALCCRVGGRWDVRPHAWINTPRLEETITAVLAASKGRA